MSSQKAVLSRLALVVATKHRARLAKLRTLTQQIARIDEDLAEIRKAPVATEDSVFEALGNRQAWAWRKEQHLLAARKLLLGKAADARAEAARTHGEELAAEKLLETAKADAVRSAERRAEREAPPFRRTGILK